MKFGVIRFPGSCDDVDAQLAASRVGEAVLLWHADRGLQGVDAVIVPGGFSYGDYLRVGAIARFAPVMEDVIAFARDGGPVLGICNGFQVLCEAGLLPGALLPNDHLRFRCRQVEVEVLNADTVFTRACDDGRAAVDPVQAHDRALLGARRPARRARGRAGRSSCATRRARTPTARRATSPGCATRRATSWASCPIPSTPSTSCAAAAPTG